MAGESFIAPPIEHLAVSIDVPEPYERNPRRGNVDQVAESLRVNGQYRPIVVNRRDNRILAGNHTWRAARQLGWTHIAVTWVDVDDAAARRIVLVDNRASDLADYDDRLLAELLADVEDLAGTGYNPYDIDELATRLLEEAGDGSGEGPADDAKEGGGDGEPAPPKAPPSLAERFGVPPFTVLDTRQGYWQERKKRWLDVGINSGDGREHVALYGAAHRTDPVSQKINGVRGDGPSIFDPVLAEIGVRWFSPVDGHVLDPFAGGSVRGLVSAMCGRTYHGIDLRPEQVEANRQQADVVHPAGGATWTVGDATAVLPTLPDAHADLLLTCPPYYDLEKYSDNPADLSAMGHDAFDDAYRKILAEAARCLRPDRFAVVVVGNVRTPSGAIRDLRTLTSAAFSSAGLTLINDAILLNAVGSAALRAPRAFVGPRTLMRVHQEVLVYIKGDRGRAAAACGEVTFAEPADTPDDNPAA